jgi:hypothetical protein
MQDVVMFSLSLRSAVDAVFIQMDISQPPTPSYSS